MKLNVCTLKVTEMIAKRIKIALLILVLGLVSGKQSFAENPSEYAAMGATTWSAFKCSVLAGFIKNPKEEERLFKYGYVQGIEFIEAIMSGKVKRLDLQKGVPVIMLTHFKGPTPDFILGQVYKYAFDSAIDGVFTTGKAWNSDEMQQTIATDKFWNQNCHLIGK